MKYLAVLSALLLAACATPTPRAPTTPALPAPSLPEPAPAPTPAAPPVTASVAPGSPPPSAGGSELSTYREFVARNDEKLLEVYVGMHRSELVRVMNARTGRWHNPYRHEVLHDRSGQAYEVFYYMTRDPEGKPVRDQYQVPVIVKDDVVVAIGSYRLKKLKRGESVDLPRHALKRAS